VRGDDFASSTPLRWRWWSDEGAPERQASCRRPNQGSPAPQERPVRALCAGSAARPPRLKNRSQFVSQKNGSFGLAGGLRNELNLLPVNLFRGFALGLETGQLIVVTLIVVAQTVMVERHVRQGICGRVANAMGTSTFKGSQSTCWLSSMARSMRNMHSANLLGQPLLLKAFRREGGAMQANSDAGQ
jgi:hypothetical protein